MSDPSGNAKFLITNLADLLSPRGLNKIRPSSTVDNRAIEDRIRELIIEKTSKYKEISELIKNYYNKDAGTNAGDIDDFAKGFHILSLQKGIISVGGYDDKAYWTQGTNIDDTGNAVWNGIYGSNINQENTKCEVCVIAARDPYMTPADAKTEDIELFMNYMPPVLVNQMIPYLDVELAINRSTKIQSSNSDKSGQAAAQNFVNDAANNLSTPSILRFLLGSVSYTDGSNGFTDADRGLIRTKDGQWEAIKYKKDKKVDTAEAAAAATQAILDADTDPKTKKTLTEKQKAELQAQLDSQKESLRKAQEQEAAAAETRPAGTVSVDVMSGMEMFLAPQALTNMDTLKSSRARLMPVKPFLPFASITNFEVSVMNAGAGAMAHKTGKLQLRIHDKSRIAEIAEFIKGPAGYATARIWTTYGWLCPRRDTPGQEDEYAKLVNDKMYMDDCWTVRNTQFTIEPGGGVVLNLDMVSFGLTNTRRASIKLQDSSYESYVRKFQLIMEEIEELSRPLKNSPIGPDARITQILNAGATGNMLPADIKDPAGVIEKVVGAYIKNGQLNSEDGQRLISRLATVLDPYAGKSQLAAVRSTSIANLLSSVVEGHDPFIPKIVEIATPAKPKSSSSTPAAKPANQTEPAPKPPEISYFNDRYINELNLFINPPPPPPPDPKAKKDKPADPAKDKATETPPRPDIKTTAKVISFGKLFTKLALPAILNSYDIMKQSSDAEVQIIFYALNDECGPVSGQSIAEFPIDLQRLSYAMDDLLSVKNKYDFTIEEFLKVVINNQFLDDRAIGYGMLNKGLFKPFDKEKTGPESAEKNQAYETAMAAWQAENSGFRKPMIEMFLETSRQDGNTAKRIHKILDANKAEQTLNEANAVIRVHIYDKQNNPRKLFMQILEMGEGFQMGSINDKALRSALNNAAIQAKSSVGGDAKDAKSTKANQDVAAKAAIEEKYKSIAKASNNLANEKDPNKIRQAVAELEKDLGIQEGTLLKTPTGDFVTRIDKQLFGPTGIRAQLSKFAPTLDVGSNGTLIKTVQLQSKTDDLMAAANLVNIMKPKPGGAGGTISAPATGLEGPGGLPIRTVPAQLTMNTVGCPALRLYQQFFVDLGTGTSLDNLYQVTQVSHKMSPGKFETTLTFMYTNGYGKFTSPPTVQMFLKKSGETAQKMIQELTPPAAADKSKKPTNATNENEKSTKQRQEEGQKNQVADQDVPQGTANYSATIKPQ